MARDEQKKTLEIVGSYLADQGDIRLALVFGSVARHRPERDSDLDVAVLGDGPLSASRRMRLIEGLAMVVGRPVDLVDLTTAGIPVARSAFLTGKVVYAQDESIYPTQLSRLLIDSADFMPYRNRLLTERREAWIR